MCVYRKWRAQILVFFKFFSYDICLVINSVFAFIHSIFSFSTFLLSYFYALQLFSISSPPPRSLSLPSLLTFFPSFLFFTLFLSLHLSLSLSPFLPLLSLSILFFSLSLLFFSIPCPNITLVSTMYILPIWALGTTTLTFNDQARSGWPEHGFHDTDRRMSAWILNASRLHLSR